jgi:hypothetical protein
VIFGPPLGFITRLGILSSPPRDLLPGKGTSQVPSVERRHAAASVRG